VFVLAEVEGLTMNEVIGILGCPLQTAYSRLSAARKRVEEFIRAAHLGAA
jgi:RNA polymerase sigma-70 factor (ECF subfamily)